MTKVKETDVQEMRYQLITVVDRSITVAYFSDIVQCRKQMHEELNEALNGTLDLDPEKCDYIAGQDYEENPIGGWCNGKYSWDWLIVDLFADVKAAITEKI